MSLIWVVDTLGSGLSSSPRSAAMITSVARGRLSPTAISSNLWGPGESAPLVMSRWGTWSDRTSAQHINPLPSLSCDAAAIVVALNGLTMAMSGRDGAPSEQVAGNQQELNSIQLGIPIHGACTTPDC
jgi:hypothetical protein